VGACIEPSFAAAVALAVRGMEGVGSAAGAGVDAGTETATSRAAGLRDSVEGRATGVVVGVDRTVMVGSATGVGFAGAGAGVEVMVDRTGAVAAISAGGGATG
jgi:hypothetical protein